jgi:DNA processing protein
MVKLQPNSAGIDKWLKLIRADGVGPAIFARLVKRFGSADRVLGASVAELAKINGLGFKTAERIASTRDTFDPAEELDLAHKLGVWIINLEDQRYPPVLKRIYHQGALSAGGRTIAVQGCGLANIFPPENKKLFGLIAESGACISELPLQYEPLRVNFPPRNRIIAGLSLGTIVVEAALCSGALITAKAALDYDREVMAVPGKVDSPLSKGAHQLIKEGARLIESVEDVMDALGHFGEQLQDHVNAAAANASQRAEQPLFDVSQLKLSDAERKIHDCLNKEPMHVEQIIAETNLMAGTVNATLISLRLKGLIKQLPGSMFTRSRAI